MAKNAFDVQAMEKKWLGYWEKSKIFKFNSKSGKKIYSIDTPPPTVSGEMHIGHAFQYSQMDFIARYKRMKGFEVFYPFGTDDNGLPTERLIERLKGVKSKDMSRADFIELCLKTLKGIRDDFVQRWKDIAVSCDYGLDYSTIDEHSRKMSQASFLELYKKKKIYKDDFPTIYCPECGTPVAQAELEDKNLGTAFSTLKFKVGDRTLPIATTRPELLGACVAVFVNPLDKRYKSLVGKKAVVPIFEHGVLIIADKSAEIDKGTGVLMICSYGDKYDVDAIKKYKLKPRVIFEKNGTLNISGYEGMRIKDARKKILQDLKDRDLIVEQKQIEHAVNVHDKCGTEIEFLPTEQWFIKILDKKKELVAQGKKINWKPEFMFKRYKNWVEGLDWDWSISRDRHFGVQIPVWHCRFCDEIILASEKELPVDPVQVKKKCPKCGGDAEGEKKVFDTWMTSSLTPQIAAGLTSGVKIPFSLRHSAHDIIRTWAFYTIVKSYYHENKVPWNDISISGFVTLQGEKMSKSKGNVVRPQEIVEKYGADSLRYWAAASKLGEDTDFQEKDVITGQRFISKILNASRFVFMNLEGWDGKKPLKLVETDRLFLTELDELIKSATFAFDSYEYSRVKLEVEKFFWQVFADNYLEIVKRRVYKGSGDAKKSAQWTLYQGLLAIVKMMAPFTPFVCEEIYQEHFVKREKRKSVHLESWPVGLGVKGDEKVWDKLLEIISKIRREKSKAQKAMNAEIKLSLSAGDLKLLNGVLEDLEAGCCAGEIKEGKFGVEFI